VTAVAIKKAEFCNVAICNSSSNLKTEATDSLKTSTDFCYNTRLSHPRKQFSSYTLYKVFSMVSFSLTGTTLLKMATDFTNNEVRNIFHSSILVMYLVMVWTTEG
jgi:hypothetical protein